MLETQAPELALGPSERQARSLVIALGEALERRHVMYCCQWKGNGKKRRWMSGEGDIDLLVERSTEPHFTAVLEELGFRRCTPPLQARVAGLERCFRLDPATGGPGRGAGRWFGPRPRHGAAHPRPRALSAAHGRLLDHDLPPAVRAPAARIGDASQRVPHAGARIRAAGVRDPHGAALPLARPAAGRARLAQGHPGRARCAAQGGGAAPPGRRHGAAPADRRSGLCGRVHRLVAARVLALAPHRAAPGPARPAATEAVAPGAISDHPAGPTGRADGKEGIRARRNRDRAGRRRRRGEVHLRPGAHPLAGRRPRRDDGPPRPPAPLGAHLRRGGAPQAPPADPGKLRRRGGDRVSGLRLLPAGPLHGARPLSPVPQGPPLRPGGRHRAVRALPDSPELGAGGPAAGRVRRAPGADRHWPLAARQRAALLPAHPRSRRADRAADRSGGRGPAQDDRARRIRAHPSPPRAQRGLVRQRRALRRRRPAPRPSRRGPEGPHLVSALMIAELVGAAGAGKSVLSQALAQRPEVMRASVWKLPRGWWLYNAVRSLPTLMGLCVRTRALPWADMRYMIRLRTLHHMLTRRTARRAPFVVLDEGPVFALAWLQLYGDPGVGRGAAMARWRREVIREWAETVDVVVLLDPPDTVLDGRIRTREQSHRVKAGSDTEISRFATAYRQAFGDVIGALTAANGVRVIELHSNGEGVDRTVDRLRALLGWDAHGD